MPDLLKCTRSIKSLGISASFFCKEEETGCYPLKDIFLSDENSKSRYIGTNFSHYTALSSQATTRVYVGCQKCMAVTVSLSKHTRCLSMCRTSIFTLILKLFKNVIKANTIPTLNFLWMF